MSFSSGSRRLPSKGRKSQVGLRKIGEAILSILDYFHCHILTGYRENFFNTTFMCFSKSCRCSRWDTILANSHPGFHIVKKWNFEPAQHPYRIDKGQLMMVVSTRNGGPFYPVSVIYSSPSTVTSPRPMNDFKNKFTDLKIVDSSTDTFG